MSEHERPPEDVAAPPGDPDAAPPAEPVDPTEHIAAIYGPSTAPDGNGNGRPRLVAIDGGAQDSDTGEEDELPLVRPKIRWPRLLALFAGMGLLAGISTVFGMMMAVASDLPKVDVLDVAARPSTIVDRRGNSLGVLTGNQNRILVRSEHIAPVMKHAIVAIEDRRFYTHSGVDLRGIGRALWQDIIAQKAVQGGSTIAQQLVKNRLEAQDDRTLFQKLRESAMAFHMTRKWDKERILRNYLNTIYFGNGAYGVESAARTYFRTIHGKDSEGRFCGEPGAQRCAEVLEPQEAALLAGIVASPSAYDPVANPAGAKARRDLVLQRMTEQGYLPEEVRRRVASEPIPARADIAPPQETSAYPYFTTWVRQQVVDQVGPGKAFEGGLRIRTTLDGDLQQAAERAVTQWIGYGGGRPAVGLVALDNRTSEVLAMLGGAEGNDAAAFNMRPFNLATQGQRQPGSAFKPFTLAQALASGISPTSTWSSRKKEFCVTRRKGACIEAFEVNNYEDNYAGVSTLANATAFSDNSVYAEVGIKVGTKKISKLARRLGIRTPVSTNPAITLGGLSEGVTVLDMAHAYQTFARNGRLMYGSLSPGAQTFEDRDRKGTVPGPVGIDRIEEPRDADDPSKGFKVTETRDGDKARNKTHSEKVLSTDVANQVEEMLGGVVRLGTGKRASLGEDVFVAGKTGTTEDYGDAWFVGWTEDITVAVWIGYPDALKPMKPPLFSFQGEPVAGGSYPAAIWQTFVKSALAIFEERNPSKKDDDDETLVPEATVAPPTAAPTTVPDEGAAPAPAPPPEDAPETPSTPAEPEPEPAAPAPEEEPPTGGEGGTAPEGGGAAPPPEDG